MKRTYEVLAPAGNLQELQIMLREKPDAVYVGLRGFSSRPQFADMSMDEVRQAAECCAACGVRLYVAINANTNQSETEDLIEKILLMDEWKVDAVILSDFGLVYALRGRLRHTAVHASTMMGVCNIETVRVLRALGVSRIIFYANLYFDEMAAIIHAFPDLEYELVAEGGTCFNDIRRCRLPHAYDDEHRLFCRSGFRLVDPRSNEPIRAKEISEYPTRTAEIVGLFMAIGVTSFKVEGRTVRAEERIPMVRALQDCIRAYEESAISPLSYLHYFVRNGREMR